MKPEHYSMIIQWDSRDDIYVVTVPELPGGRTHGKTYEEAVKNALEVIELWIEDAQKAGEPIDYTIYLPMPETNAGDANKVPLVI